MPDEIVDEEYIPRKYEKFYRTNGVPYAFVECPIEMIETAIPEGVKWGEKEPKVEAVKEVKAVKAVKEVKDADGKITTEAKPAKEAVPAKEEIPAVMKKVKEFTIHYTPSLDGTKCVISIAAMQIPYWRQKAVTEADLDEWEAYLDAYGYTMDKWLNASECAILLGTSDYSDEIL
jgi:hypothetical protein